MLKGDLPATIQHLVTVKHNACYIKTQLVADSDLVKAFESYLYGAHCYFL